MESKVKAIFVDKFKGIHKIEGKINNKLSIKTDAQTLKLKGYNFFS